jgi:hypothetical protein
MKTLNVLAPLLICAVLSPARAAELKLPREGWVSWEVAATEGTPAWCCWGQWKNGHAPPTACPLDDRGGYGMGDGERDRTTDSVKVYARLAAGKVERLQVLAASCPVQTRTPVQELGTVSGEDSARWLIERARQDGAGRRSIGEDALAALAMHEVALAGDALADFARKDASIETRKTALFWLAQLRGEKGVQTVNAAMFGDPASEVRKHAAFAITQSKSAHVAQDLIRLGKTDEVGDVRAQAWFWLSQSELPEAEAALNDALRKDPDDHVREQAIFALSQLPDERATRALIAVAEDRALPREQRKRAVFWLSQAQSDSAQAYLEKILASNVAH